MGRPQKPNLPRINTIAALRMSSIPPQVKILELSREELACEKLNSHTLQAAVEALHLDGLVVLKNAVDVAHLE